MLAEQEAFGDLVVLPDFEEGARYKKRSNKTRASIAYAVTQVAGYDRLG